MASLLDLIVPPACASCGRSGTILCDGCLAAFTGPVDPRDRFVAPDAGVVIGQALTLAVAAFAYEGAIRRALGRLKYAGVRRVAGPLGGAALPTLERLLAISGPAVLVPVPASPERLRERGYNQAELLATALARESGLEVRRLLARRRETTKQHRLDRAARLRNLRGAFAPAPGVRLPRQVILVDDILTTSATLEACASVLLGAGAERCWGLAIACEV